MKTVKTRALWIILSINPIMTAAASTVYSYILYRQDVA